ncbi:hypothetical protein GIB67_005193 [Kingdonia uniflora]|uniref:ATP synthase subunit alpha, mitochondrial n=1 Tax=Kingdonia uniflora TaxID=39325 RepID=A0A7J7NMY1_9MAGN|nr:hypothetical protein GIB67_005193 [Kingdonia uniflora]
MEYTIVVAETADAPATLQYLAPYTGAALAEYFMYHERHTSIIYDNPSKQMDKSSYPPIYSNSGIRPTINVGISASRVGSAAQIKAMKQVAGKLKLELAQFAELETIAQFISDLDKATHNQLARGQRLREMLKQSQSAPLSVDEQIVTIYTETNKYLDSLEVSQVNKFLGQLRTYLKTNKPQFQEIISSIKTFTEEAGILLKEAIEEHMERFLLQEQT